MIDPVIVQSSGLRVKKGGRADFDDDSLPVLQRFPVSHIRVDFILYKKLLTKMHGLCFLSIIMSIHDAFFRYYLQNAFATHSAVRIPSTAADIMPPA